jgi:hypothetical protein
VLALLLGPISEIRTAIAQLLMEKAHGRPYVELTAVTSEAIEIPLIAPQSFGSDIVRRTVHRTRIRIVRETGDGDRTSPARPPPGPARGQNGAVSPVKLNSLSSPETCLCRHITQLTFFEKRCSQKDRRDNATFHLPSHGMVIHLDHILRLCLKANEPGGTFARPENRAETVRLATKSLSFSFATGYLG